MKSFGRIILESKDKINLLGILSLDNCILLLLLENNSTSDKKVLLEIVSNGYVSYNGFKYEGIIKANENKYLFPLALDRDNLEVYTEGQINLNYKIVCSDV